MKLRLIVLLFAYYNYALSVQIINNGDEPLAPNMSGTNQSIPGAPAAATPGIPLYVRPSAKMASGMNKPIAVIPNKTAPTIAMPELTFNKQALENFANITPGVIKDVEQSVSKFSADIRGALIKTGQFKVLNIKVAAPDIAIDSDKTIVSTLSVDDETDLPEKSFLDSSNQALLISQKNNPDTEYYLLGVINYIGENEDSYPLKGTSNLTKQYVIEVEADFKLVRARDHALMASFSATGSAHDIKIVSSNKGQTWHHNIGKLVSTASKDLASDVVDEIESQFNFMLLNHQQAESDIVTDVQVYS
ncbi:MAG: hypothetical protein KBD37_03630 [Burkholderiales bacterium]|nr:hypothetical protein [Burkholderiales bacterium]